LHILANPVNVYHGQIASFNTTLVQLKGTLKVRPRVIRLFQYHTGPIKRFAKLRAGPIKITCQEFSAFQYHTGPIKRRAMLSEPLDDSTCFNTTLVQLKAQRLRNALRRQTFQYHTGPIKSQAYSFNTTLVQLKGPELVVCRQSSFNTTLVQLKASTMRSDKSFDTGPIKSEPTPCNRVKIDVSIPHWSN
jgi:hypothetical protein